ncbi:uncharacterized protein LOC120344922 isoform X3 [Styela clava]
MEIQGWINVCDIRGIPAHQLSCGQAAPTVWNEKYCALFSGRLWMLEPELLDKFFSEGDNQNNVLCETESCSSVNEEVFSASIKGEYFEESTNDGRRRRPPPDDGLKSPDVPDSLINKSFLQKKITPAIRRPRGNKPVMMPGKENRPYLDMTSLVGQGGKQPESDIGTTFFAPTIETPDMLDLTGEEDAIVRPLHHSILGKEHCFEVITVNGSRCFCCKSAGEREAWIEKIKRTLNPHLDNIRRTEHQLSLWVQEAKGIPIKKKYFCEICLDRQLYARTTSKLKDDNTTFWGEHFDFTSIPDIEDITVHLYKDSDKKKKKDKDYVGLVNISVQMLSNRQTIEKWYTLSTPSGNNKNKSGETMAIRIKARFQSVSVLPMEQYKEFAELISKDYMTLCKTMRGNLSVSKKDELSKSLVSIMHATGTIKEYMTEVVMNDVRNIEEESLIFRENTIATKSVEHFLRLVGMGYLHEALGDFVTALYESDEDCEVDGNRLPANAILEHNQKNLQMCCEIAMCKIMNSIKIFPNELREVFSTWRAKCETMNRPRIASKLITASLFLRLLCPAILNPSLFALANELPRPNAARTLTLVAKVIQNLANRSRFGDKEEYMKFMNGFVREQWDQMGGFLDDVTDASKTSSLNGFEGFIDLGRELAKLHAFFTETLPEMDQNIVNDLGNLPKVLGKITDLINHPPPSPQNGSHIYQHRVVSKSTSQLSALDKISEDAQLSNANDNILMPPDSTSTPNTGRRNIIPQDVSSLLDMDGYPTLTTTTNLSDNGSQTSIPANGSFNNSNNSHRPSLASMENVEFQTINANAQQQASYQAPRCASRSTKPPLSFSNPAYLQRGLSSPAALSSLDQQPSDKFSFPQKGMNSGYVNGVHTPQTSHNFSNTTTHTTTTVNSNKRNVSTYKGQQTQPLSFANPLQVLQTSTSSETRRRSPNPIPVASLRSNSQIETVFASETVSYLNKVPYASVSLPQSSGTKTQQEQYLISKSDSANPLKAIRDADNLDHGSSEPESANDSFHSNDTLSSRPSSTTTGSTANSGSVSNHIDQNDMSRLPKPKHRPSRHGNSHQGKSQGSKNENTDGKVTATSTCIPVLSARHRTGLQKQNTSPSKAILTSTAAAEGSNPRKSSSTSNDPSRSSSRVTRSSSAVVTKNGRAKVSHKFPNLNHMTQLDQEPIPGLNEELPSVREVDDLLVSGKPVTAIALNAASATRVRMARKTRPGGTTSSSGQQSFHQPLIKTNSAGERYYGGRRSSNQRTTGQFPNHPPPESAAFPPTTPEGPLSPEERTAQWILSSVASVTKDAGIQGPNVPQTAGYSQSKSSRSSTKDHDDLLSRLKGDNDALRKLLTETDDANRSMKQREDSLMDQVKASDRREARLHEKLRIMEEKLQRQMMEKDEKTSELIQRISKVEEEQKREREELQGIIDEKDIIVSTQRKRINSLEESNARLLRAVNELKERSNSSSSLHSKSSDCSARRQGSFCQGDAAQYDVPVTRNHRAQNQQQNSSNQFQRRPSGQTHNTNYEAMDNGSPTTSFVNGEYRIEGLSSAGSSSSSV